MHCFRDLSGYQLQKKYGNCHSWTSQLVAGFENGPKLPFSD